ncbi:MAG: type II secretion system protein [Niameybacter sp.]
MRQSQQNGYTLLELVAVIAIMGILSALATYSVNIVFDGNTKSFASQFASEVRSTKDKVLASKESSYAIQIGYDTNAQKYYYEMRKNNVSESKCLLKSDVSISRKIGNETKPLKVLAQVSEITFNPSTGQAEGDTGIYIFENMITHKQIFVNVIKKTGSVIIDEK